MYFKKRSQGSIEVLVLLAVSLVVLMTIIQTSQKSLNQYESMIDQKKTDSVLNEIVMAANLVYQQGDGAKTKVLIDVPENIENITIKNKTITATFFSGTAKYRNFNYNVLGELPTNVGSYYVEIEAQNNVVLISTNISKIHDIPVCGNSIIELGEECDNLNLNSKTCMDLEFSGGILRCSDNCMFDTSGCTGHGVGSCDDCSDDNCTGLYGPNYRICCNNVADCPGSSNCVSCIDNECVFEEKLTLCNSSFKCSFAGNDGYDSGGKIPSQGYCDGAGNCNYAKSNPVCSLQEGDTQEGYEYNMCIDGRATCIETCDDGIDNDADDLIDCFDPKCQNFIYSGGELPNFGVDESLSKENGINMSENLLLFHLNDLTSNVIDYSGNDFNGITNADYVDGKIGKALYFNENNHRLRVENFNVLNGENQVTIAAWVMQHSLSESQYLLWADGNVLIEFGATFANPQGPSNLRVRWNLQGNWRNSHIIPDILDTNVWNHWVFVFDEGTTKIYKNSQLIYTGSDSQTTFSTNGDNYDFGLRPNNEILNGLIDEVAIWNRTLMDEEIKNIYNLQSECDVYCPSMMCFAEGLWKHSIPIHIKAQTEATPKNYQVLVNLDSTIVDNFNWSYDCNDIRFFDENKKVVDYWVETCNTDLEELKVWVKINDEITTDGTTITMYYDNEFAQSESNVSNVFINDSIFLVTGRCPSGNVGCNNFANHAEADYIRANIGINSYDIDDFGYVEKIDHDENIFGNDDHYYSRYRFLFVPKQTREYTFLTNSDDGSEAAFFPGDGYGGGIKTSHPFGPHFTIANWYGNHGARNGCTTGGDTSNIILEKDKGYWIDYMQNEFTGGQLARLCIDDGFGYKTLNINNFADQIYARQYTTLEPIVEIDYELPPDDPFEEIIEQWDYFVPLTINAHNGYIPKNYQILIHINDTTFNNTYNWDNECKDFRFITSDDFELDYYIDECNLENNESYVWIKTNDEINELETTINLYYGNNNAVSKSSAKNVFIEDEIFLVTGRCPSGAIGCSNLDNHEQATHIKANIGLNPYDIDGYDYVNTINHNLNLYGDDDRYYSRYRFMFIPKTSGTYWFGTNSDDGSEVTIFPKDGYSGGFRTTMPYGEHEVVAHWYGAHGDGTCGTSGTQHSKELEANKAYWFDYIQQEATGNQLSQMCINDNFIYKTVSKDNFPGQIYARSYITPEPNITSNDVNYIGPEPIIEDPIEIEYPIGGEIYYFEDYIIHAFTNESIDNFTIPEGFEVDVEYLIVAGGGGGGSGGKTPGGRGGGIISAGGGGGAGGLLTNVETTKLQLSSGEHNVIIGNGGLPDSKGEDSSFAEITSEGGGFGGKHKDGAIAGGNGGSGGGAGSNSNLDSGSGITNQGHDGGDTIDSYAGGGGGADSIGETGTIAPGSGGDGLDFSNYFGTDYGDNGWFAGGGGAGIAENDAGKIDNAGLGGGGSGYGSNQNDVYYDEDGIPNTGGGGGGAGSENPQTVYGGSGGSGIVLIRYKESDITKI
ncbi:MAG: DUF2341 domain-containing protein [Candidatus Woesearchaeota archaeon]